MTSSKEGCEFFTLSEELFKSNAVSGNLWPPFRVLVLVLAHGADIQIYTLSRAYAANSDNDPGQLTFYLSEWNLRESVASATRMEVDGDEARAKHIVTSSVVFPRAGSLYGVKGVDGKIAGLISIYANSRGASTSRKSIPLPGFASMPWTGLPEDQWPPELRQPFFGEWFWKGVAAGRICRLDHIVAKTKDTFYWYIDPATANVCYVTGDIRIDGTTTLRPGTYVTTEALISGYRVPPFETARSSGKPFTDLSTRF